MTLTRKEREREFRRNEILSAAIEIFAQKGFTHTTLDEVAEASEFGKGTLYNYFPNKEALYIAILERIFEEFINNLKEIDSGTDNFRSFTEELVNYLFDFCINNKAAFILLTHKRMGAIQDEPSSANKRIKSLMEEAHQIQTSKIEKAIKAGEIKKLDPKKIMLLLRGMVFSYAHFQLACNSGLEFNKKEEADFILSVIFNGIKK